MRPPNRALMRMLGRPVSVTPPRPYAQRGPLGTRAWVEAAFWFLRGAAHVEPRQVAHARRKRWRDGGRVAVGAVAK